MGRTPLLAGTCVALTVFVFLGCASKPRETARGRAAPSAVAQGKTAKPQAGTVEAGGGDRRLPGSVEAPTVSVAEATPSSIAQHAEVYAHNLETLLAKRAPAAPPTAAEVDPMDAGVATPGPVTAGANASAAVEHATKKTEPAPEARAESTAPTPLAIPPARMLEAQPPKVVDTAPDPLLQQLTTRVQEYPRDPAAQLDYQLLQFLRDESVPDLGPLSPLPAEDRELLATLLDGLSNFRNGLRAESNMLQSKKVSPLLEMGDRLRGQGELTLPTAALCTKVDRFGVYEPITPAQFKSGAPSEAVLYCEVANFSSQIGDGRQWETRLKHECVLYSETGLAVWKDKTDAVTDQSRNRRHDFYVVKRLRLPALPVGRYLLKVSVTDLQVNRVSEVTVPLQVVAQ